MKKLLLIPFLALAFGACSTDTDIEELETARSAQREMLAEPQFTQTIKGQTSVCLNELQAATFISTVNGINNPTITFISQPPANAAGSYSVRVEMEELADCEDFTNVTGNKKTIAGGTFSNVYANPPQISGISPAQTFPCYKWRMVFEISSPYGKTVCSCPSPWYDAPLF